MRFLSKNGASNFLFIRSILKSKKICAILLEYYLGNGVENMNLIEEMEAFCRDQGIKDINEIVGII